MITFKTGNILSESTEALVNTVNCVGIMGRGLALQFKKTFPDNFNAYVIACKANTVVPGKMFVYETNNIINPKYIINFPTKRHWKGNSKLPDIETGLQDLRKVITSKQIQSIAIPPLGAGLGGLNWFDVKKLIAKYMIDLDVNVVIYEPNNELCNMKNVINAKIPDMTTGRAVLVQLINRYIQGLLDPFITLLEIHKLMYFMQESGEPLKLKYSKAYYGPYSENLHHVLNLIEGYYVSGYSDGGDEPYKEIKLVPGAFEEAQKFLSEHKETLARFEKVSELIPGFESSYGLELLSTVHWVIHKENKYILQEIIDSVYSWNEHKKQIPVEHIELAFSRLQQYAWV